MASTDRKSVDELLATAAIRLLQAGALVNHMRVLHAEGRDDDFWRTALTLGDYLTVGGGALTEAQSRMLAAEPFFVRMKGELLN